MPTSPPGGRVGSEAMLLPGTPTVMVRVIVFLVIAGGVCSLRYPNRSVPVGLLFDHNSGGLPEAFEEQIMELNKEPNVLRLVHRVHAVDATDSFDVSRALCSLLSAGAIVLLGHVGKPTLATIKAYSESLEVPFIFLNNPSHPLEGADSARPSFQFYLQPSISKAIVDIVQWYEWTSLVYIYNTNEGLFRLEQVHDYMHDYQQTPEITARHVQNRTACLHLLHSMHTQDRGRDIRVVMDVPPEHAHWVINSIVEDKSIYKIRFHFILPYLSMKYIKLRAYKTGGVNITGFEIFRQTDALMRSYFSDPSSQNNTDSALAKDAIKIVTEALSELQRHQAPQGRWHLLDSVQQWQDASRGNGITCSPPSTSRWRYGRDLAKIFAEHTFTGSNGKIRFSKSGQRSGHSLDVIEVSMYRGVAKAGVWTEENFIPRGPEQIVTKGNRTIDNRTRIVVTIEDMPYIFNRTEPWDGIPVVGRDRFSGYCSELADMVSINVGYEYYIRLVKDNTYGAPQGDGTWNGIIGELIRHEADIAFAPLTITSDREKVIDFTKPFMSLGISIMIKKPENQDPHVFSFMEPLSQEIWLCTVFAFIGVSVVLFLVSRFSSEEWNVDSGEAKLSNDFTIGNSLWFSLGAFMQQGCDVLPKSVSGRIVTSVWWFFTLIIISSYTANLAAYLTTMRMSTPIKSAEDLAKQTEIKYGTLAAGSTNAFFNKTTVSLYGRMWSFMTSQKDVFVKSNEEGIAKVRGENGKYAFLIESSTNEYHNNREPCDTMKVGGNLDSKGYGVATPMGSDIRDLLTLSILELREHGKLEELKKYWWFDRSECPKETLPTESKDNALTLTKVAGIFYILVAGLALSVISVVLEFLYKTKVDSRRQNVSFGSEARSKFRLSISGHSDDDSGGQRTPLRAGTTFTYTACDGHTRTRTQTVV